MSPIIFDPELRKDAEEFNIPLSARFINNSAKMIGAVFTSNQLKSLRPVKEAKYPDIWRS